MHNILLAVKCGGPDAAFRGTEKSIKTQRAEARLFKWEIIVCLMALRGCQTLSGSAQMCTGKSCCRSQSAALAGPSDLAREVFVGRGDKQPALMHPLSRRF